MPDTLTKMKPGKPKTPLHPAEQYALDVVKGKVRAGRLVRLACKRHRRDLKEQKKRDLKFVPEHGQHVIDFFETFLVHFKGKYAGEPFLLDPWIQFVLWSIFGWYRFDKDENIWRRRFNIAYLQIGRNNGKTTVAAGIGLYCLGFDGEAAAECYAAATKRDQARLVFDTAKSFLENSKTLQKLIDSLTNNLNVKSTGSKFQPISSDVKSADGYTTHFASVDEYHAHPNAELMDKILTSMGSRLNPLVFIPTTAGIGKQSPCREIRDLGVDVLNDRKIAENHFFYIAEVDEKDDWQDPKNWIKANPSLGKIVSLDFLHKECQKAKDTPRYQNTFRRFYANQWVEQDIRWLDMRRWEKSAGPLEYFALEQSLTGRPCHAGLDLASVLDLCAFAAAFEDEETNGWQVLFRCWVPEETIHERAKKDGVPYPLWAEQGYLIKTEGEVADYDRIRADIIQFHTQYQILELAIDRWNSLQLQTQLMGDGITVVPFGQGFASMSSPSKEVEKCVRNGTLHHGGHPVAEWAASNVTLETDAAENIKPSKKKSTERIDPMTAMIMAIGRAMVAGETGVNPYDTRGVILI